MRRIGLGYQCYVISSNSIRVGVMNFLELVQNLIIVITDAMSFPIRDKAYEQPNILYRKLKTPVHSSMDLWGPKQIKSGYCSLFVHSAIVFDQIKQRNNDYTISIAVTVTLHKLAALREYFE